MIVPTRNEARSVGPLMRRLSAALGALPHEVIFVDDSDDGTPGVLAELAASEYRQIRTHHRPAGGRLDGLSGAVLEGFAAARGEYVAVIDADLQHPPELLPRLLDEARGADIVIASRYVGDGSAEGLADPARLFVSRATALFIRLLFVERLRQVHDPASGFFLVRRALLQGRELRPVGYKILLEVLMRTPWRSVAEVPYRFAEREEDVSKADVRQGLVFLTHCGRLLREVPMAGIVWKLGLPALGVLAAARLRHRGS